MSDPILHADRACKDMPLDVFFPPSRQIRRVQQAQVICAGCPVRRQCAEWAAPLVDVQDLVDCVIAGVQVPICHNSAQYRARRAAAVAELQDIAAGRDIVEAGTEAA